MYADEEEDKVSAKDRIFSSIKRRVANKPQIEVYEEDVEDEAFDEQVVEGDEQVDMRHRLNFKVQSITDYLLTFGDINECLVFNDLWAVLWVVPRAVPRATVCSNSVLRRHFIGIKM